MFTATVDSENQITVPSDVRRRLGLVVGTPVTWEAEGDVIRAISHAGYVLDLPGMVSWVEPPATIEQMDDAISDCLSEREWSSRDPLLA
jgi:bifunctional DNA-binding transcriptional regulator/antitoxin component of YhaV-PrlF toxin-antitoxin module